MHNQKNYVKTANKAHFLFANILSKCTLNYKKEKEML